MLSRMTRLQAIISAAAGVDHITRDPLWPRDISRYRMGDAELGPQMAEYVLWVPAPHRDLAARATET